MNTIKLGSRGNDVKRLQQALGVTPVDGICGQMTVNAIKAFQLRKGLTPVDGIAGPKTLAALFPSSAGGVTTPSPASPSTGGAHAQSPVIVSSPISVHITPCSKPRTPKYIVIHYTAGASSAPGRALAERNTFISRSASADFVVDDATIVQINPDPTRYYCWAVGDNSPHPITNSQCVSIEMCSNLRKGTSAAKPNHEGWTFTKATLDNAVALTKSLMKKYHVPLQNVVRHFDVSGKLCPGVIGWNSGRIYTTAGEATSQRSTSSEWDKFKQRLANP